MFWRRCDHDQTSTVVCISNDVPGLPGERIVGSCGIHGKIKQNVELVGYMIQSVVKYG